MKRWLAALCGSLALGGCGSAVTWESVDAMIARDFPDVNHITPDQLPVGDDVLVLDVRDEAEYAVSHLPGAMRVTELDLALSLVAERSARQVVAYCSVGYRSSRLAQELQAAGVDAVNLHHGIFGWANGGRAVVRDDDTALTVHPYDDKWGVLLKQSLHPGK